MSSQKVSLDSMPFKRGKVRDVYEISEDRLLIIATDRVSAFDYVLPTPVPDKGAILTAISRFWFATTKEIFPNHIIDDSQEQFIWEHKEFPDLANRSMVVRKAEKLQIEAIVRGYITGSAWSEYERSGSVCGIKLPEGLQDSSKIPEPIFTPSTKAEEGHDENISFEQMAEIVGEKVAGEIKDASLKLYKSAAELALKKGIIIADTKFEFGYIDGKLCVIDEIFTPDSSRFWPSDSYREGSGQPSFDKQYIRDYLNSIKWNKQPPVPELPANVVEETIKKYNEIIDRFGVSI